MEENQIQAAVAGRRWSDRMSQNGNGNGGLRDIFSALKRRRWVIASTFVAIAAAFLTVFQHRASHEAVCMVSVKKPSQVIVAFGQPSASPGASVPLLEGQTYKLMVEGMAFADRVSSAVSREGLPIGPEQVKGRLKVEFRDPDLLKIRASDKDPASAIHIANTACRTFVEQNQNELREEMDGQVDTIARLKAEAGKDMERAQTALGAYIMKERIVNTDPAASSLDFMRTTDVRVEQEMLRAKDEAALTEAEAHLKEMKVIKGEAVDTLTLPVEDPAIVSLRTQIEDVRVKLWEAKKYYTDAHPEVKDLGSQLSELQEELDTRLKKANTGQEFRPTAEHEYALKKRISDTNQEITAYRARIKEWSRLIDEQQRSLGKLPGRQAVLERLKHDLSMAEDRYRVLSVRLDETRITRDTIKGTVKVIQPAVKAEPPNTRRMIMLASLLLISLPAGVGLVLDYMDNTIRSPLAINRHAGLFCLAEVPKERHLREVSTLNGVPAGSRIEAFNILRSGLRFASGEAQPGRIAVVSGKRREGRSTIILHLARVLTNENRRVVIVDTDLRSPSLPRLMGMESRGGILEVFTGEMRLEDALLQTPFNATMLPAMADGMALPLNAELIFRTKRFGRLIEELSLYADVVLFDTSPILEFADTIELLPHAEGVIVVAEAGSTTEADIQRTLDVVRTCGARSLGIVLNKTEKGKGYYA